MKITMDEVAKRAGVSKTTVSRIINGNFQHVHEDTKEKVLKIINELNYRPNALAKSLKQMKTNVIGIVLSNLQNPFWSSVLQGVEDTCHSNGYNLMICNSNDNSKLEQEHIEGLQMKQVDGIIVNPTMKNKQLFQSIIDREYPIIAINRKIEDVPLDTVVVDNIKGSELAMEHFIELGKSSIAIIVYPPDGISPREERLQGYKSALINHGHTINEKYILIVEEKKGAAKEEIKKALTSKEPPDAIFSTNNMMTLEILEGIKELGMSVPQDVSLIGYDETVWSKHLAPPLTTVNQPSYEMGKLAAEKLINLLNTKQKAEPKVTQLQPNLIIRESC
ncbi:LacI family DNA-binding transcriptional regulator [Alkalihalobacterium alkalinitrilicum]|uniref:LacI family DNA-binding transcriptional regulator n=1 Tax=Alkalihalobacterium alkalinitrilicum TaxID=427920 RepID=UPI000995A576|nr:LacI family DNA-binding transcriptional regulator [Alkalihalobacterium alkalinitrilicum]